MKHLDIEYTSEQKEEDKKKIAELKKIMEEKFSYLRPFLKKYQIFTENDLYQYIKKDKQKPEWVNFKRMKFYLRRLFIEGELRLHVIPQEQPRPNTLIYYIPEIIEERKWGYISCIEEKDKLKTDCHEILFKRWNK